MPLLPHDALMAEPLEQLEAAIGYTFQDRPCLVRALTHKSRELSRTPGQGSADNEQLEFLGDSILGFLVSEWLLETLPHLPEGHLSKRKAQLVSTDHLYAVARRLDLGSYLLLGRGEELSGGRDKKALLADAVEAVLAAVYLDGGLEAARRFVFRSVLAGVDPLAEAEPAVTDYKTALQERAQALRLPAPRYHIVRELGPEHAKRFTVEARLGSMNSGEAEGTTKKGAEQKAAQLLLAQLPDHPSAN